MTYFERETRRSRAKIPKKLAIFQVLFGVRGLVSGMLRVGLGLRWGWCRAGSGFVFGWFMAGLEMVKGMFRVSLDWFKACLYRVGLGQV